MAGLEKGMVCIKTRGKEAGRKVVIVDFDSKKYEATIDGPLVKKRKCNAKHLLPTGQKIDSAKIKTDMDFKELLG